MSRRARRTRRVGGETPYAAWADGTLLEAIRASRVAPTSRWLSTRDPLQVELFRRRGPTGARWCRWCLEPCPGPRRTFCGAACLHEWKLRSRGAYMRRHVEGRDHGVCAACGVDSYELRARAGALWREEISRPNTLYAKARHAAQRAIAALGLVENDLGKSLWDVDHIVAVIAGGGCCGLDNLQTLCVVCHRAKTKKNRAPARERGGPGGRRREGVAS